MQRFLVELHFRSLPFVIARVSKIGGGLLPARHGINSPHAAQVAILYHCRLPFCHSHPGEGFVAYVDYLSPPVDDEVCGQLSQARYYALLALIAVSDLHLSFLGQKEITLILHADYIGSVTICRKSFGKEIACVVAGISPTNRKYRSLTQK